MKIFNKILVVFNILLPVLYLSLSIYSLLDVYYFSYNPDSFSFSLGLTYAFVILIGGLLILGVSLVTYIIGLINVKLAKKKNYTFSYKLFNIVFIITVIVILTTILVGYSLINN